MIKGKFLWPIVALPIAGFAAYLDWRVMAIMFGLHFAENIIRVYFWD